DPAAQPQREQRDADQGKDRARHQPRAQQRDAQPEHERPGGRRRHLDGVRSGVRLQMRLAGCALRTDAELAVAARADEDAPDVLLGDLVVRPAEGAVDRPRHQFSPHRPNTYTSKNTTTHTPSTKCQYHDTSSAGSAWRAVTRRSM